MKIRGIIAFALMLVCAPALAQVNPGTSPLSGAKGGTNNGFMQFTGPSGSMKTYALANASGAIAMLGQIQTWTGAQSFTNGTLILLGSGSGSSTINAPATGGGTATLFPGSDTIVGLAATQTLTNKTITSPAITGGTIAALTGFGLRSTGSGAFDLQIKNSENLTANRSLDIALNDAARAINIAGNLSFGGAFTMSGGFGFTGTVVGATNVTFPTAGTLATLSGSETLTNKTFVCANQVSCVIRLGSDVSGTLPIGNGGTGQTTAIAARQSSGLNVYGDAGTGHGDAGVTLGNTERFSYTTAAFTASRAWVLPAASVTGQPYTIKIADLFGGVTATNTLVITRAGADTINGGSTATISAASGGYECSSDGSSKWSCLSMGSASAGGVSSIACASNTVTTSGTCTGVYVGTQSFCPSGCTTTVAAGSTGTYTPTAGVTKGIVEVVAPGGGGGGAAAGNGTTTLDAGGGGGGGGYCGKEIAGIGSGLTVTLGALGTGGAANTDGGTGGTTSFDTGGSNFRATGGVGGTHTAANTLGSAAGGAGGAGVNCDLNIAGNSGGFSNFNASAFALSGAGGSSGRGYGGGAPNASGNGAAGGNFGGGGGGGAGGLAATATGGAGGNPIVLVHEYK